MNQQNDYQEINPAEEQWTAPTYEEIQAARKLTLKDIKDHISGPVLSFILHIIAIAFLSTIIVFESPKDGKEIEVKEVQVEIKELEKIPEPPEPEEVQVEQEVEIERPDVTTDDTNVVIEDVAVDAPAADVIMPNILSVKPTNSALVMPALFGMRTGNGRKAALKKYGGSSRTEKSVLKGLRWLKDHQNSDGSWGDTNPQYSPALTGLALLAFLAHGETPSSAEFGPTVLKAIQKLVDFLGPEVSIRKARHSYSHAIVIYALSEAYAVTRIPMLEETMNKGMLRIVNGQNSAGSFDYFYKTGGSSEKEERSDLSVAGWNYQAMKAAFAAGSTTPGLEQAIDKAVNVGLKQTHLVSGGGFKYEKGGSKATPSITAVGTLCLQLLGEGKSPEAKAGLNYLEQPHSFWISWDGNGGKVPSWPLYQWYYQTQAFFQGYEGKGGSWKKWNQMFTKELMKTQKSDGRWESPCVQAQHGEGSYLKGLDQPVYSTALCCLMLEVYYRYLPTFKIAKNEHLTKNTAEEENDLGLKLQ